MARARNIRVIAVPKAEPDVRLYVLALIEFVRHLDEGAAEPAEQSADDIDDSRDDGVDDGGGKP